MDQDYFPEEDTRNPKAFCEERHKSGGIIGKSYGHKAQEKIMHAKAKKEKYKKKEDEEVKAKTEIENEDVVMISPVSAKRAEKMRLKQEKAKEKMRLKHEKQTMELKERGEYIEEETNNEELGTFVVYNDSNGTVIAAIKDDPNHTKFSRIIAKISTEIGIIVAGDKDICEVLIKKAKDEYKSITAKDGYCSAEKLTDILYDECKKIAKIKDTNLILASGTTVMYGEIITIRSKEVTYKECQELINGKDTIAMKKEFDKKVEFSKGVELIHRAISALRVGYDGVLDADQLEIMYIGDVEKKGRILHTGEIKKYYMYADKVLSS